MENLSLYFNWFIKLQSIGEMFKTIINSGDIYVMSEKVVGNDWKKKSLYTLRHSAGCDNIYTKLNKRKVKNHYVLKIYLQD